MKEMTDIPQNYNKNIDWIIGAYNNAGVSFPNGFQKDAIQNACGARAGNDWSTLKCDIYIKETSKGKFLIVEDSGTVGLTGNVISSKEIRDILNTNGELPSTERLSRFTSMFNSGGNTTGGGLYGAGKSVYSAASNCYTYYFDSLRQDGIYVSNINKAGQVLEIANIDIEAKQFIYEETGLEEKRTVGTRIIIVNPRDELIESINNGELIEYIQESWWKILKMKATITVNGIVIHENDYLKGSIKSFELSSPEKYAENYKVKHFGLYIYEKEIDKKWSGLSYYRKGMKIGKVEIDDIPKELIGKFWGYIEVDKIWEDALSEIEDNIHFGISKGKKKTVTYQYLKAYCEGKVRSLFIEWGYIKNQENINKKLNEQLNQIATGIQDLFDKLGFEDLGTGPKKSNISVRWKDIIYPALDTEKVTTGDRIKFSFIIKNTYSLSKKIDYSLEIIDPTSKETITSISTGEITVLSNKIYEKSFSHEINEKTSKRYSENKIVLTVNIVGSNQRIIKELPYFYDFDKPDNKRESVELTLHECNFPIEGSRRVNSDEAISNISYRIENKRNHILNYKLNISIHNASDPSCPKIKDIDSITGLVNPFEEVITPPIESILFSKDEYENYIPEGVLELRARLLANEDDEQFEKGDKITSYKYKIFFNTDEKHGKNKSFETKSVESKDDYRRSWYISGINRTIFINVGHAAYLSVKDEEEFQYSYLREQMLKQYVLLYLAEGKYDMFKDENKDFTDLEPEEAVSRVIQKIEKVYYESLE